MRRSDLVLSVVVIAVALMILVGTIVRTFGPVAGGGLELTHCGCAASKNGCEEPCTACCGPEGMKDCWKNPNPSGR